MTSKQIIALQERVGTKADGFWGPKSVAACQAHLRRLMPKANPWPSPDQASLTAFYGAPGDTSLHTLIEVPYTMFLYDANGQRITRIGCHNKVAASLARILEEIASWPPQFITSSGMRNYFGCYNNRTMRGSRVISTHARAIAVDFDARRNGNATHWPTRAHMPIEVMEVFAKEGWTAAGAAWSRDGMHFEATKR